jgi:VWFA-related protein
MPPAGRPCYHPGIDRPEAAMIRSSRTPVAALALPLATLLGVAGTTAVPAHAARPAREQVSETTSVVAVEVPVVVLEDGKPVRGLTRDDFILEDGRNRQALTGFEVLDLKAPASRETPVAKVPIVARRHFLLLFDLTFSEPSSVVKARDAAKKLLDGALHPADLVAVGTYSFSQGPQLVLGFTSDPRQVRSAIDHLGFSRLADRNPDPLGLLVSDQPGPGQVGDKAGMGEAVLESIKALAQKEAQAGREQQKNRVAAFTRSVADLARIMGSVEGRKHVVFLSEGFDSSLLLGTTDEARIAEINQAVESGETYNVDSEERFGNTKSTSDLTKMLEEFRRADCTIQAVDIGGLRAEGGARPKGEDSLYMMASGTGGELFRNANDLSQAMGDLLERTSVTYVLSFQPADLALDGKYHRLRVRLKDEKGGRRVIHRPGYYAPLPYEKQSAPERQLAGASLVLGGEEGGSLPVSVLAAPYRMTGQKAYVPVLVEIDGAALTGGGAQGGLQAELLAYAFDDKGEILDHFGQQLGLDLGKVGPALRQGGLKYYGHLDLDPGEYVVRVLVRDGKGGYGLATTTVSVPGPDAAAALLLPPLFPDPPAPNRWVMVREPESRQKLRQVPYPFMMGEQPFIPAARPVIPASGMALFSLVGWGLGRGQLAAEAQLYGADGAPRPGGEIKIQERLPAGVSGSEQLVATFRPGGVPAGPYTLVVTLTDPASGKKQSSSIPVTVAAAGAAGR